MLLAIAGGIGGVWLNTLAHPDQRVLRWYAFWGWFISYDGGFVRRGLGGEIVRLLSHGGSAKPALNLLVFVQYTVLACLTAALLIISARASNRVRFLTLAAPFGLLTMARMGVRLGEKEISFHVCLAAGALWFLLLEPAPDSRGNTRKLGRSALVVFLFLSSLVLPFLHEAFIFLAAPAFLILLRAASNPDGERSTRVLTLAFVTAQLILFGIFMHFKGSPEIVDRIWRGVNEADRASVTGPVPRAIAFLGWSSLSLVQMVGGSLKARASLILKMTLSSLIVVPAIACSAAKDPVTRARCLYVWLGTFCFLAAMSAPVYIVGLDWDRWVPASAMSWTIVFLAVKPEALPHAVPLRAPARIARVAAKAFTGLYQYRKGLIVAAGFVAAVGPGLGLFYFTGWPRTAGEIPRFLVNIMGNFPQLR